MERKGQVIEIIIKMAYAIVSFIIAILIVKNTISMFLLFNSSLTENELYEIICRTDVGNIFKTVGVVETIDKTLVSNILVSFLMNIPLMNYIFLFITILVTFIYFIYIKWTLLKTYLKMSYFIIIIYALKFVLYGICFLLIYKDDHSSLMGAVICGNVIYILFSFIELFVFGLWILKFLVNISEDIKTLISN